MAKNYFGVVLTTKEHDKYRLVVYRYKDPGILNTCPMRQLLRAIHKFQQEYTEIHREHCSRIPPRKWYELGRLTPPTIEIEGFLGGAARFIAKPCLKQRVMRFPIIHYGCSA